MSSRNLLFLVPLVLFFVNICIFLPFLSDDALISLRYSTRFVSGQGLTWNDGERVEGYSDLLWVLLVSGLLAVGLPGILSLRVLGILFSVLFLAGIFAHYRNKRLIVLVPLLFAALSAPLAVWALGGLEQPLVLFLVSLSVPLLWRAMDRGRASPWILSSIPLAFLCLTRPDGALFTVSAFLAVLFFGGGRKSLWLVLLPVLFISGQTLFRLQYYDDWIPNTARIKVHPSLSTVLCGAKYVITGLLALFPLSALSLAGFLKGVRSRCFRLVLPGVMAGSWLLYILVVGGDFFPAWRHFLPVIPLFTWQSAEFLCGVSGGKRLSFVMLLALVVFVVLQYTLPSNRAGLEEHWEWDARVTALALREAFGDVSPLVAVTAAGSIPYWTGFPSLDMLGLNDRYLGLHPGHGHGECIPMHSVCNADYVLSRNPDIVSFNAAGDTTGLPVARALVADHRFTGVYSRAVFRGDYPYTRYGLLWFNRNSSVLGVGVSGDTLRIPPWFLGENKHTICFLADGIPGTAITPGRPARGFFPELAGGSWHCISPSGVSVRIGSNCSLEVTASDSVFLKELVLVRGDTLCIVSANGLRKTGKTLCNVTNIATKMGVFVTSIVFEKAASGFSRS